MDNGLFSEDSIIANDKLMLLTNLCSEYKSLEQEISSIEENLKNKKLKLEEVSRISIPSIFNELGLSQIKLQTGQVVSVEDKLKVSIADKNYLLAFRNMVNAEGGDGVAEEKVSSLFKSKIIISEDSEDILNLLLENDIPYEMKRDIHYQTLAKYCREKLDSGGTVPEGISIFQYQETKIK